MCDASSESLHVATVPKYNTGFHEPWISPIGKKYLPSPERILSLLGRPGIGSRPLAELAFSSPVPPAIPIIPRLCRLLERVPRSTGILIRVILCEVGIVRAGISRLGFLSRICTLPFAGLVLTLVAIATPIQRSSVFFILIISHTHDIPRKPTSSSMSRPYPPPAAEDGELMPDISTSFDLACPLGTSTKTVLWPDHSTVKTSCSLAFVA